MYNRYRVELNHDGCTLREAEFYELAQAQEYAMSLGATDTPVVGQPQDVEGRENENIAVWIEAFCD